jgi:hypothetical protein
MAQFLLIFERLPNDVATSFSSAGRAGATTAGQQLQVVQYSPRPPPGGPCGWRRQRS